VKFIQYHHPCVSYGLRESQLMRLSARCAYTSRAAGGAPEGPKLVT
jgi:hypothetical protein